jgi:tetratricopeptide (TPR) repeat protein
VTSRLLRAAAPCAALVWAVAQDARAGSSEDLAAAQRDLLWVSREAAGLQATFTRASAQRQSPEQRLANGELLYRMKDYDRAVVLLSEIIEEFPNTPSYPDALWLRGETFYVSHDYLAARRDYGAIVDRGAEPRFQTYFGRALARIVDVAIRMNDPPESFAPIVEKFNLVPPAQLDAALLYAKGKVRFRQGFWNDAIEAFSQVGSGSAYAHQARYFRGVAAIKLARPPTTAPTDATSLGALSGEGASPKKAEHANYKPAIEVFRTVTVLPPDTPDHQHVIDLAWMAVGRLFYEMEQYQAASEAYSKVSQDSPEFDTMLYELAWVYVRLGDMQRAERALELLMVSDPNSPFLADGTLLRADLLLRSGAFDRALQLYQSVLKEYDPMRARVASFLDSSKDVGVYYEKLAQQELELLDQSDQLPPIAIRWAREAEDGPAAFAVIDEVNGTKKLIKQSNLLVDKLVALSGATNRARAFPELEAGEEAVLALLNRTSKARLNVARGLDDEEPNDLGGELGQIRNQRRALMAMVEGLPVAPDDFAKREQQGLAQWNKVSQELTQRSSEIDALQAAVNGLRRVLSDGPAQGVARDPASVRRFQDELDANEHDLKVYREAVTQLRRLIDMGRVQIGLGDARYRNDMVAREQFRDLLDQEVRMVAGGGAGSDARRYTVQASPLLSRAREYEEHLALSMRQLDAEVALRADQLAKKVETERALLDSYGQELAGLDIYARDLVGRVAQRNFGLVRDKLGGIILRADVGVTQQGWEVREEELSRVRSLQSERARQEQLLDEELKEVRDDGVEPDQSISK